MVRCGSGLHQAWAGVATAGLILWAILPPIAITSIVLWYAAAGRLDEPAVRRVWGQTYLGFTPQSYWWLLVEYSKKLSFAAMPTLLMGDTIGQISLLMLLILCYCMLHTLRRPFVDRVVERVAFAGHVAIFLLLLCAMLIAAGATLPGAAVAGVPFLPLLILALSGLYVAVEIVCRKRRVRRRRRTLSMAQMAAADPPTGEDATAEASPTQRRGRRPSEKEEDDAFSDAPLPRAPDGWAMGSGR